MSNVGQWTQGSGILMINSEEVEKLSARVRILGSAIRDLSPLFEQMSVDFYKDQKRMYSVERGPGQYVDLAKSTKKQKQKRFGFTYPVLFATGRLAASLLSRTSTGSVNEIGPRGMIIGTSVPYAGFHMFGTRKMPARTLWDESPDNRMFLRWNRLVDAYMQKAVDGALS